MCDNIDVEELTRKIDESINRIENENKVDLDLSNEIPDADTSLFSVEEIDRLINEIDERLSTLKDSEDKVDLDLEALTQEINDKLDMLDEEPSEDNLEKTLYDLSEISNMIKEALSKVDKDKEKKKKKAMYCDMARKNKNKNCNHKKCYKK
jgi:hypothetical protein